MIKRFTPVLAVTAALMFGVSTAHAKKPLDVNCDVLEAAIIAVDGVLPPDTFGSLGELISASKKDPATFGLLSTLIYAFSGNTIDFTDPKEVVPTIAKCGLTPLLVELVTN